FSSSRSSTGDYASTRVAVTVRDGSGNAGHAHSTNFGPWAGTWTEHRPRDRTRFGGRSSSGTRVPLSGPPSTTESRLDRFFLGDFREQPQSEVLPADSRGAEAVGGAEVPLGAVGSRDRPDHESGPGGEPMNWRGFFNRAQADAEQQQELESYIEITADEYIA